MTRYPKVPSIATSMPHTYRCTRCGMPDNLGFYPVQHILLDKMREKRLCYHCAFWENEIENPTPNREIIGGNCYAIKRIIEDISLYEVGDGSLAGAKGYIIRKDWTIYRSNDICLLGKVPDIFREQLPDTAKFITLKSFRKIAISGDFRCKAKGCWDRYHCLRYDMNAEADGAFNVIPDNYEIGGEKCPSFINITDLYV